MQTQVSRNPLVSVCLITYNHAPYIAQAIESVLAQNVDFEYEILIGEDDSSDGTKEIVLDYQNRYPGTIRVFRHSREEVIYVNGLATGRWNYFDTLSHAKGKYVAFLEGDDYWTDTTKLQKQVNVLENQPELSVCTHKTEYVDENGHGFVPARYLGGSTPRMFSLRHVLPGLELHANSWLFRRIDPLRHPRRALLLKLPGADDSLMWVLLTIGNGCCLNDCMSAYRINSGGTWTSRSRLHKQFERLQLRIAALEFAGWRRVPQLAVIIGGDALRLLLIVLTDCIRGRDLQAVRQTLALNAVQETMSKYSVAHVCLVAVLLSPALLLAWLGDRLCALPNRANC